MLAEASVPVQVGGGVRTDERVEELLAAGAARVVVGTRALEEPRLARRAGAIGIRASSSSRATCASGGRRRAAGRTRCRVDILDVVEELNGLPLGGLLVTAVHKEGQLQGTDLPLMEDVVGGVQLSRVRVGRRDDRCRTCARSRTAASPAR